MKKLLAFLGGIFATNSVFANPACAVCTVAVGATLAVTRNLGVCDNSVAVWLGAFLVILGYWAIKWFDKKNWNFYGRDVVLMLLSFSVIGVVYIKDIHYTPCYWILDAFLFWGIVGGIIYALSQVIYEKMKRHNNNHAHFPFEKVVIALVMLFIVSVLVSKYAI